MIRQRWWNNCISSNGTSFRFKLGSLNSLAAGELPLGGDVVFGSHVFLYMLASHNERVSGKDEGVLSCTLCVFFDGWCGSVRCQFVLRQGPIDSY